MSSSKWYQLSTSKMVILGFFLIINVGAFLLSLPISSTARVWTPYIDTLFTSTSATCVTGLVINNTATYWSTFGQLVILTLIQIGGMGFFTVAIMFSIVSKRKIGLKQRFIMQETINAPSLRGIVRLTRFVVLTTFTFEALGALLLSTRFIPAFGIADGIYYSIFHSISAFCNAGFDLFGHLPEGASLVAFASDPVVNITIMLLIIVGGLGFFVCDDIRDHKFDFSRYSLHTKIVLLVTSILIIFPFIIMLGLDWNQAAYEGLSPVEKCLAVLFQTITPRTAGFNTVDIAKISTESQGLMIFLMLVGGSSGSTAGGMKTTTILVLFLCVKASFTRSEYLTIYGRRISNSVLRNAVTIAFSFLVLFFSSALLIHIFDAVDIFAALFESASAIATVGLTLGITTSLSNASLVVLVLLMFFGRVGCLTAFIAFSETRPARLAKLPKEQIAIG